PLIDYGKRLISLKNDLILSHIELQQAEGMIRHEFSSLSEAVETYRATSAAARRFSGELTRLRQRLSRELNKRESALRGCEADIPRLGNPEELKRRGDLILSNLPRAAIENGRARLIDYFDPDQSVVEIEIAEGQSLKEAAAEAFARYQ